MYKENNNNLLNTSLIAPYSSHSMYSDWSWALPQQIVGTTNPVNINTSIAAPKSFTMPNLPTKNNFLGNIGKTIGGAFNSGSMNGAATAVGGAIGSAIGGGMSSGVGNAISGLGNIASAIPGPWGAAIGAGLKVVGGLTNRAFGSKLNEQNIASIEDTNARLNSFQSNANSFDTLANTWGTTSLGSNFSDNFVGKDGWFSNKAKDKANQLREEMNNANTFVENSLANNAYNLEQNQYNNMEANYAACGGFLNRLSDGGSIHINPENRGKFNATKARTGKTTEELTHSKNPLTRKRAIFAQNAAKWQHAYGGPINQFEEGGGMTIDDINNSMPSVIIKALDPTGITSYYDVYQAGKQMYQNPSWLNTGKLALEILGAVPIVGKAGKVIKGTDRTVRLLRNAKNAREATRVRRASGLQELGFKLPSGVNDGINVGQYQYQRQHQRAYGGDLNTDTSDFTNGITFINEGGTHEENPYGGIMIGTDKQGVPNMVEEGETIFNDYVFSDRLTVPDAIKSKYKLRGNKLTYSDAVKQLAKNVEERPNDSIAKETNDEIMNDLIASQEQVKAEKQRQEFKKQLDSMSPEEKQAVLNQILGQEQPLNSYPDGGEVEKSNIKYNTDIFGGGPTYTNSNLEGNIPWIPTMSEADVRKVEATPEYKAFTKYVLGLPKTDSYWTTLSAKTGKTVDDLMTNFERWRNDGKNGWIHRTGSVIPNTMNNNTIPTTATPPINPTVNQRVNMARIWNGDLNQYGDEMTLEDARNKGLLEGLQRVDTIDGDGKTVTYWKANRPVNVKKYNESLRYAPIAGLGLASFTDALGLTNKPDYSGAGRIEAAARAGNYMPVDFSPIGEQLTYRPFDRDYTTNMYNSQLAANRRAIANQAGNRGAAIAGILAADNSGISRLGDLAIKADEYNNQQRQQVANFNRGTSQYNSEGQLKADMANQAALAAQRQYNLQGILQAANLRQQARQQADAARSANLSGLFNSLGNMGYENAAMNMRNWLYASGVLGPMQYDNAVLGGYEKAKKGGKK